jgi:8-oxo-dGTP pyrophosphatase MutT (NUDIX family)
MKEEFSSGGIVYKKTNKGIEILFIKDSYGKWAFPKGHIDEKETKIGAAAREVSEETGIKIKDLRIKKYLGDINYDFKNEEGEEINKTVHFYLMKLINPKAEITPQEEDGVQAVRWVDIEQVIETSYYDDVDNILKTVVESLKK